MLMQEFAARFSARNEKSFLFEILHRVSRLDARALMASSTDPDQAPRVWSEWPPLAAPAL
jgi:hypothetical protein